MTKRILLIGATGNFGQRLAHNLARVAGIELCLASRSKAKAQLLADTVMAQSPGAHVTAVQLERENDLEARLVENLPWLVIDASGPFQGADYRVPLAAMSAGAHFIDIADGLDYLRGFDDALDGLARARQRVCLGGVSSSPALSSAVVAALTRGWQRIDSIDIAITPDGTGDVGHAAVAGVLTYAGQPVPQFRHGNLQSVLGWMRSKRIHLPRLGWRRVAPVETIDAELLSRHFKVQSRVAFYAGLESPIEMTGLRCLARLRSMGTVRSLLPLVSPLVRARALTRLTSGLSGGMVVEIGGLNSHGRWTHAKWSLLAEEGHGLNVPGLPVVAAVRLLLDEHIACGARVVCGEIALDRIEAEFTHLAITTQTQIEEKLPIFEQVLGPEASLHLAPAVADFHDARAAPVWEGTASVDRGSGLLSRLAARIVGLPQSGKDVPIRVTVERGTDGTERWTRRFGSKDFHSIMSLGRDAKMWERFGLLNFRLGLEASGGKLNYPLTDGRLAGFPIPRVLLPTSDTFEDADEQGRFRFDVRLVLPFSGLLVHYKGWLKPVVKEE